FKAALTLALLILAAWHSLPASARLSPPANDGHEFFEKKVRPLFAASCAKCHNPKARIAGLDLTTAEGFTRGGESGALVDKEKPEESRLLKVVSYDGAMKMPPTGKLKDDEVAVLTAWVKMGAPWPGAEKPAAAANWPKNSSVREFTEAEKAFWSYQPVRSVTPPAVKNASWAQSPIDRFILQKLEEKGLAPAPAADKLTLLRRATFDLTGLPPSENEIREFLADNSPDAFKKVVDRLLASPRYGERWGRHWLDVARYADSTGNDEDHRYPHAWKYRDYVIESFNKDLPYDQFVGEQIAGDLLPPKDGEPVNRRGIIATGFLALGPKAIAQQDKKKMLYDVYDEQVEVTSKAFLGLTLACARCHNHKFDPLLTRDYYAMTGIFASTRSFTNPDSHVSVVLEKPLVGKEEFEKYTAAKKAHQEKEKCARLQMEEIVDSVKDQMVKRLAPRMAEYMLTAHKVYQNGPMLMDAQAVATMAGLEPEVVKKWVEELKPKDLTPQHLLEWRNASPEKLPEVAKGYQDRFLARLAEWEKEIAEWRGQYQKAVAAQSASLPDRPKFEAGEDRFFDAVYMDKSGPFSVSEKDKEKFSAEQQQQIATLQKQLEVLKKSAPAEPDMACAIEEGEQVAQPVFIRGDYNNHGEDAPKSFPAILSRYDTKPAFSGSGRLQLAEWLTQPEHPLTARVMANRIWQWHFGEGIVRTPDNFGIMGERPTHPELLDYLAKQFVAGGWSVKAMHRQIMLSSAYQMASINPKLAPDADPDNRLLMRFNRRRLSAEEMRDAMLRIDGTIDLTVGGSLQTGRGTDGENNQGRLSVNPEKQKRRTVYLPLRRANLPTLLNLFDFGDATTMSGKRQLTNVATQALFWLNSQFLTDRSVELAKSLLAKEGTDDAARVEAAYLRILNRRAEKEEIEPSLKYIAGFRQRVSGESAEQKAWQSFCRVLLASNDFLYLD
ncbi:MAG: PSD1 and planctomycete cytochrome C domain-containing protein, partial [Blastocatellia bacterium]